MRRSAILGRSAAPMRGTRRSSFHCIEFGVSGPLTTRRRVLSSLSHSRVRCGVVKSFNRAHEWTGCRPRPSGSVFQTVASCNFSLTSQQLQNGDGSLADNTAWSGLSKKSMIGYFVAGGIAGGVSRTVTAPLDRLKVFLQVHSKYDGIRSCLQDLIKEGGVRGLWRGNGINVMKTVPDSAMKFMAYEQTKAMIEKYRADGITIHDRIFAGSLAGCMSQTIIYPLEALKTRLTLRSTGQYMSILDAAVKITRREGFRWLYRGFLPNILGVIPYSGIDLATYETIKLHYLLRNRDVERPGLLFLGGCAAVSSTCGLVVCYPLALLRTKLQAQERPIDSKNVKRMTMSEVFREVIQREGFFGLYRGLLTNIMKVIPAVSITYMVNERCRQAFGLKII